MGLMNLVCRAAKHRVDRKRVWHDGLDYRTVYTRCGASLIRDTAGWRSWNARGDANVMRFPRPRER